MTFNKKVKVPRLVQMHSDEMHDVEEASAGDIVAFFGVDCASGDTFTDGTIKYTMTSMFIPNAVIFTNPVVVGPPPSGQPADAK